MTQPHTDLTHMRVRGAADHNLRHVDVDLPLRSLVVVTGVSGSGKSTLAFHTIYAEAQRRYFESVAPYARRLLQQVGAPRVETITGLPPAVALRQRRSGLSSRSTVGTIAGLANLVRMLYSRVGDIPDGQTARLDSDAFSPNTAHGACPACHGLGEIHDVSEASLVPDPSLSIADRAVAAWPGAWQGKNQRDILAVLGYDIQRPWSELDAQDRQWILFTDEQPVVLVDPIREPGRTQRPYKGMYMSARRYIMRTLSESRSEPQRKRAMQFVETRICESCNGSRLRRDALDVTYRGLSIVELSALPFRDLAALMSEAHAASVAREGKSKGADAADQAESMLSSDIHARLIELIALGLDYLSLERRATTLASGEHQRLRIATQLRSGLFGVVYVLDEPTAGLHPSEVGPLVEIVLRLRDEGNSVIAVEHNLAVARSADWIVDMGPGAGIHGGSVLYSGPVAGISDTPTSRFLNRTEKLELPSRRAATEYLSITGAHANNIRGLDLAIPLGVLCAVTGVSGSGKSTLLTQIIPAAAHEQESSVKRVIVVDQAPIGRTPRSNIATYTGMFDLLRRRFAETSLSKERGYDAGRFSFNVDAGRCATCQGEGSVAIEMLFLPGTYGVCADCNGSRYNPETLEVTWRDMNIADVLALTVEKAAALFADDESISRTLRTLLDVGLGYVGLGQPATELSGGEAQRIKLATELQRKRRKQTMYVLDEPSAGLHPLDATMLMEQLTQLVRDGSSVVLAEHSMSMVAQCDWVIDLGPGGGDRGGTVVSQGTPEDLALSMQGVTPKYLAAVLDDGKR